MLQHLPNPRNIFYKYMENQINIEEILEQAQQGDASAQCVLGMCYCKGINVSQSNEEAVKWIRLSADQGFAAAQDMLAFFYENGTGVTLSYEESAKWYRKAAEQGYTNSQSQLAYCYAKGIGVQQSYEEAAVWYLKAAEQGNVDAQSTIGSYYAEGKGVPQSFEEAVKWFRLAAEQGDAQSQHNLGYCYARGKGVPQSTEKAVQWLKMSAEQGDEYAIELLKELQHDNNLNDGNTAPQTRDLSDVEELFNTVVNKMQGLGLDATGFIASYQKLKSMLLSMEDEEMFRSSKKQLLESLQGNLRDVESARQKAEAMLQTPDEPNSEGGGCAIILAFLLSPAFAIGGYGLYNLLS